MKRQVDYTWRLAELMAARGMHNSTELIPLLAERGIQLSRPQVYRVVHQRPERVSLQLIAALCDILSCGVDDLLTVTATDVRRRKASVGAKTTPAPNVVELNKSCVLDEPECSAMTISPNRPSTKRGRPLVTDGHFLCSRCQRMANQRRASWPGEDLCYSCYYTAMRTRGICPRCGHDGMLPGLALDGVQQPICRSCAGIPGDFTCRRCGTEADLYRRETCARCALRDDLTASMIDGAHDPEAMAPIVDALCRVDRPASILTWKLSLKVQALLAVLASGDIPLTHQGLDDAGRYEQTAHLRSLLEHNGILPARDEPLARFERWLTQKLDAITEPAVRTPVEQFATWHHLRRLRRTSTPDQHSDAATRYAKQDITEAIKFLTWLHSAHQRPAPPCLQQDVDEWLASGPTTRSKV